MQPKHPLANCAACPWNEEGKFVPSLVPNNEIKLAIVGEAPGSYEATTGIPFTGPSGELLDKVLDYHGVARRNVAFINTVSCRPPGKTEKPPKQAVAACRARLDYDLKRTQAPLIVSVGGVSAQTLLEDNRPISKLRIGQRRPTKYGPLIATWHPAYCVAPETKVLKADLRWLQAKDLEIGDELIGFNEDKEERRKYEQRQLRSSYVTAKSQLELPCFKITLEDARTVIVSGDHQWLAKRTAGNYWREFDWTQTYEMVGKDFRIAHYIEPWKQLNTRDAGYIAGFLDGEGYVSGSNIAWSQNEGPTSDNMLQLVKNHGFEISKRDVIVSQNSKYKSTSTCKRFEFKGKRDSIIALGMFRPERLIINGRKLWEGKKANYESVLVKSVEYVGIKKVISITTTTSTFIAEGLLSHNCLRSPDAFPSFVRDLGKIYNEDLVPWTPPEYKVFNDPTVGLEAIRRLRNFLRADEEKRLCIDIEAASDKDIDDSHPEDYEILCVGVGYDKQKVVVFGDKIFKDSDCISEFRELLLEAKIEGWNVKFDLLGLSPIFGMLKASRDGMLMSYIIDERPRQHGLKQRGVEDQNAPRYDEEITQYIKGKDGSFAKIPKDLLYRYNAYDVGLTWDEIDYLNLLMSEEQHKLHNFLIDAANMLMRVELSPMYFDLEYNDQLDAEYQEKLAKSEAEIHSYVGYEINPRSPMQIVQFFVLHGLDVPTTSREFLEKLHPACNQHVQGFIDLLLENRKLSKTYGTYIRGLRRKVKDGKIYTTFSLHSTTSGRTASKNPNMQNVKRDKKIRNQFTAEIPNETHPNGKILIQADYSQVEGRVICNLARDRYLQSIFSDDNIDIFNNMCDQIWGVGSWDKENRVSIKSIFYGNAYGREARSIANELKKPLDYTRDLMNKFNALIPDVKAWQESIKKTVLDIQELTTPFGRKRTFHLITNENMKDVLNEALSYLPQSIASDICLRAAIRLQPMLKQAFDADIKLLIHDAIVVDCIPEYKESVIEIMIREMVKSGQEYTDYVPFKVEATSAFRLGEL